MPTELRVENGQLVSDQWVLTAVLDFKLRPGCEPRLIDCPHCNGHGHFGGGPLGGEPEDCQWCMGHGKRTDYSHITEQKPEMPIELVAHMRESYGQYLRNRAIIDKEDQCILISPI